jgi:DNA ligase (NAD+)
LASRLTRADAERRLRELRAEIRHHNYLYYVKDRPAVSDEAYDALFHELKRLETEFPDLATPDSPTRRVGGMAFDRFPSVEHPIPMRSLDSDRDESSLRRFDDRIRKAVGDANVRYALEPKLDGASIELVYEDGVLVQASTRGDGLHGEGVTENVRTIPSVPLRLAGRTWPPYAALRGEVIMRVSRFEELNERLLAEGQEPFANPRNAAAGALRQLDPTITASRPLEVVAYDVVVRESRFATHGEVMDAIASWGFQVPDDRSTAATVDDILAYHAGLLARRDDLDIEIDGVVIKLDDLAARERLGATSRHPRWAFAYKFPPRRDVTRILAIVASVGRTGIVTPVAMLRPVELGGVTIGRATLHNREEVARKDVREGDLVRIQRAGDVIPQVIERVEEADRERGAAFSMPAACPSCGAPLVERGPFTVCPNGFECPAQLVGRIVHFASREALDIQGLGDESARLLVAKGLVRSLDQIFDLRREDLVALERFAEKSADNLVGATSRAATVDLSRFLYGLGIPEVGVAVARDLATHFGTLQALRTASEADLMTVEGVGPKMAEQISGFFRGKRNADGIDRLLEKVTLCEGPARPAGGPLEGKKFVFTGALSGLSRPDAEALVTSLGARTATSVSKKTDYVVAGEEAGTKRARAEQLGLTILDEEQFLALMRRHGARI